MTVKLVLCGDGAVGKTAVRQRYLGQGFSTNYMQTMGANFAGKYLELPKTEKNPIGLVRLQIWDLAGQPSFEKVRSKFYTGTHGALLIFDVTRPESFENMVNWLAELLKYNEYLVPTILVGNKVDLRGEVDNTISLEQGQALAEVIASEYAQSKFPPLYIETSAKTGQNIDDSFQKVTEVALEHFLDA